MRSSKHFLYKFANAVLSERLNLPETLQQSVKHATIGVILPGTALQFFGSVIKGISNIAGLNGYRMLVYRSNESMGDEIKAIRYFLRAKVDGILASVSGNMSNYSHFNELQKTGIPMVFFNKANGFPGIPSVSVNDFQGGYEATRHLIHQGYKRIAHIAASQHINKFEDRLNGYKAALNDSGLPVDESLIYPGNISISSGKEAMHYFFQLDRRPDAVFAVDDLAALGVLKAAKEMNLVIPNDLGVIGFGNESFNEHLTPGLSSIDQQSLKVGKEAVRLLAALMQNSGTLDVSNTNIIIEPLLKFRESSLATR